jgi:hypothetical protein
MRTVMLGVGIGVLLVVGAALWIDEGEVVTLVTSDPAGQHFHTELWIAEHEGVLYLRGTPRRAWVRRLLVEPRVELIRNGRTAAYQARLVEDPDLVAAVSDAMTRKYGAADRLAGALFDRGAHVAVRLDPVTDTAGPEG